MPKKTITQITLPDEQPDCCAICPLCGVIPKSMRNGSKYETHVCIGTSEALTSRGINVRASQRDSHHPLSRPCDARWDAWMLLPGRRLGVSHQSYLLFRLPYEQSLQMIIKFKDK